MYSKPLIKVQEKHHHAFLRCPDSFYTLKDDPDQTYDTMTLEDLEKLMATPMTREKKEASFFIPSSYVAHDARNYTAQRRNGVFVAMTIDVDTGNVPMEVLKAAIEKVVGPVLAYVYSSSGATLQNKKWRGVIPLASFLTGAEFAAFQNALYDDLEAEGITVDRTLARAAQANYLPNVPADKRDENGEPLFYQHVVLDGDLLDPRVGALHDAAQAILDERQRKEGAEVHVLREGLRGATGPDHVRFAAKHFPIASLLEQFGYEQKTDLYGQPSDDWRSPFSSGFSTRDYGDHWISLSYTDAEKGIGRAKGTSGEDGDQKQSKYKYRFGGAFDLIAFYQFGNDTEAAKAAMDALMTEERAETVAKVGAAVVKMSEDSGVPLPPEYVRNKKGHIEMIMANVAITLETSEVWRDIFAYDIFNGRGILTKGLPGQRGNPNYAKPMELSDDTYIKVHRWFQQNGFNRISKNAVIDAVDTHCRANEYHPVRDFLDGVRGLDTSGGLLDRWLFEGMGADPMTEDQHLYTRAVGRAWLISAVARVMRPGCKADAVLVFEGKQGIGKSTALKHLAGEDFFKDHIPDMHSKDASSGVKGFWIIELGELAGLSKSDVESQKAFLSRTEETYRPAYGRLEVRMPRQCVFAGSTNKTEYLRDETGGRRFWPVRCGKVDLAWIKANKDALWAEALAAYEAGEQWHLTNAVEAIAAVEQAARHQDDVIAPIVLKHAAELSSKNDGLFSMTELCKLVFVGSGGTCSRMDHNRVKSVLESAGGGFVKRGWTKSFNGHRMWRLPPG